MPDKQYDSNGQEIKLAPILTPTTLPANMTAEMERIRNLRVKLQTHKKNSLFQTKQSFILKMFLGWNSTHLAHHKAQVLYFEDRIKAQEDGIIFADKSLEFSQTYVMEHGDDEDKASMAEGILKKIEKLRRQQAELQSQYDEQLIKEGKK